MFSYRLFYFDIRNLAEPSRMILHYAKVPFEDVRISFEEWPALKEKHSFRYLPVLEENGEFLGESTAIARYLARKYGLAGKDDWEQAKVDELTDYQSEIYALLKPYYLSALGVARTDEKDKLYVELCKPHFPEYLKTIGKLLYTNNSGYLVGEKETFIDFWVADYLYTWQQLEPKFFKHNQNLVRYTRQIHSLPRIAKYVATRPERPF
ncbi:Glutathione S-transferase domain containing protein [Aphelenchoides bicaudatus]|nr:Glutathione S-transferase domain containing protein [Aphelenchoides bicaudatus]